MRFKVNVLTCIAVTVININIGRVLTVHQIEECTLQPSELGPDWYKVSRPVPQGSDGKPAYEPSYIHMPCAKPTVFDIGVCGCTSLMSFIFTSVNKGKQIHHEITDRRKVDPDDFIKRVDDSTTARPPVGSLLINTRTGEVKECPFRASSRGPMWYLIREPRDHWRHMVCAAGTVFEKKLCTCVHKLMESREPERPEDANIVIIEEDWITEDKTISQSLGISISDVDFSKGKPSHDIPFWRRQDLFGQIQKEERESFNGKSDVKVTLRNHELDRQTFHENFTSLDIGKDEISAAHKDMLLRGSRGPISRTRAKVSPLVLDSNLRNEFDINNDLHSDNSAESLLIHAKQLETQKPAVNDRRDTTETNDIMKVLDQVSTKIEVLKAEKRKTEDNDNDKEITHSEPDKSDHYEKLLLKSDCSKKPLPDLGPQYFLLDVMNIGYIPFTCHGNSIYNDTVCACLPTKEDLAYDEDIFPVTECTKRALPELGPQYFLDHLLGVGYIPYVCHGERIFEETSCACV